MAIAVSVRNAERTRRPKADKQGDNVNFIGANRTKMAGDEPPPPGTICPVAYLVEQNPMSVYGAHFHVANQFQLFVKGRGRIGPHPVEIGIGHFSAPYSPYGPIVAAEQGISYLTLRNAWDGGAQMMPGARPLLKAAPRNNREVVFGPVKEARMDELAATRQMSESVVLELGADGLGAWEHHVPPGASIPGPDPTLGGGQYWVVIGGTLDDPAEGVMERLSCVFVPPDDPAYAAKAGPGGAQVLIMQFPRLIAE